MYLLFSIIVLAVLIPIPGIFYNPFILILLMNISKDLKLFNISLLVLIPIPCIFSAHKNLYAYIDL